MAQRRSRKKSGTRSSTVKKPELRKPQTRDDGSRKPRRSERPQPKQQRGPVIRVRAEGRAGLWTLAATGWVVVALVLAGGVALGRWFTYGFPDWAWLYVAFGMLAAAPAVGYVARRREDVDFWVAQAVLVAMGVLVAEAVLGPPCPTGADCGAYGARGVAGIGAAVLITAALALASRYVGFATFDRAVLNRPTSGRSTARTTVGAGIGAAAVVGLPLALVLVTGDMLLRPEPGLVRQAREDVTIGCFRITDPEQDLAVRPDPEARSSEWTSLLVRRADEARGPVKGVKGSAVPDNWLELDAAHPYEAHVSYDDEGTLSALDCRKVSPAGGKADAHDLAPPDYGSESPIKPQELLQAPATPPPPPPPPAAKKKRSG